MFSLMKKKVFVNEVDLIVSRIVKIFTFISFIIVFSSFFVLKVFDFSLNNMLPYPQGLFLLNFFDTTIK